MRPGRGRPGCSQLPQRSSCVPLRFNEAGARTPRMQAATAAPATPSTGFNEAGARTPRMPGASSETLANSTLLQ